MVNQYPDSVTVSKEPEFEQDANGNFEAEGEGVIFSSECRGEPAGSNPVITGADGNETQYAWIVYMPKTDTVFVFGDKVTLTKADGSEYKGSLKLHVNGAFNSRLWV